MKKDAKQTIDKDQKDKFKKDKAKDVKDQNLENLKEDLSNNEEIGKSEVLDIVTKAEYDQLKSELNLAKLAAKESMDMVKIFKSDLDRIKERTQNIDAQLTEKITINFCEKIIPILDNFEQSFDHIKDEVDLKAFKMLYTALKGVLDSFLVRKIDASVGVFDANKMEAIMTEKAPSVDLIGTVATVFKDGYYYEPTDKVIRYTQVSVYK